MAEPSPGLTGFPSLPIGTGLPSGPKVGAKGRPLGPIGVDNYDPSAPTGF